MTYWDVASLIGFEAGEEWAEHWRRGEVRVLPVWPHDGVAMASGDPAESSGVRAHLGFQLSSGRAYDPEIHCCLGWAGSDLVFMELKPAANQVNLRLALVQLSDLEVELAMRAVALAQFHTAHPYCPQCGQKTVAHDLGRSRLCEACGAVHFPRTDPAVIVAVTDSRERLLLGHHAGWEKNRYSVFAGFVEAGEALEQTVQRELREETGYSVAHIQYIGSQPWPLPRSLMVGFSAKLLGGDLRPDGVEITSARWFDREQLRSAVDLGEVILPIPASIAHRMISQWYGEPV